MKRLKWYGKTVNHDPAILASACVQASSKFSLIPAVPAMQSRSLLASTHGKYDNKMGGF